MSDSSESVMNEAVITLEMVDNPFGQNGIMQWGILSIQTEWLDGPWERAWLCEELGGARFFLTGDDGQSITGWRLIRPRCHVTSFMLHLLNGPGIKLNINEHGDIDTSVIPSNQLGHFVFIVDFFRNGIIARSLNDDLTFIDWMAQIAIYSNEHFPLNRALMVLAEILRRIRSYFQLLRYYQ